MATYLGVPEPPGGVVQTSESMGPPGRSFSQPPRPSLSATLPPSLRWSNIALVGRRQRIQGVNGWARLSKRNSGRPAAAILAIGPRSKAQGRLRCWETFYACPVLMALGSVGRP